MLHQINKDAAFELGMNPEQFYREAVPLLLKEQTYQKQITIYEHEIKDWQAKPKARSEVESAVKALLAKLRADRENAVLQVLKAYQTGERPSLEGIFSVEIFGQSWHVGCMHKYCHDESLVFNETNIKKCLACLDEGVSEAERASAIAKLEAKIAELKGKIETECWPPARRYYDSKGNPRQGRDRWGEYLQLWKHICRAYNYPVDHEGRPLEKNSPAWKAFHELKLDECLTGATDPRTIPGRQRRQDDHAGGIRWQ